MARLFRLFVLASIVALLSVVHAVPDIQPVRRGMITYYFDNPAYIDRADSVLKTTRLQLEKLLRANLSFPAEVYMVETRACFDSLIGGSFPEWGGAAAQPFRRRIILKSPDSFRLQRPLHEVLAHEYAHLALTHRIGRQMPPPRWMDEGLAQIVSMEWNWSSGLTMGRTAVFGEFLKLKEIEKVNRFGKSKAAVAYAQSYMAMHYLFEQYGIGGVNILLDNLAAGHSLDQALIASTGSDYADFEKEYRLYLHSRFNSTSLLADTMYFWLALAVILIIGAIIKMRKRWHYYKKWDEEEKLGSTDFDYGDPDHPEHVDDDDDEPWRH